MYILADFIESLGNLDSLFFEFANSLCLNYTNFVKLKRDDVRGNIILG